MDLGEKLFNDMKDAMKSGDKIKLSTIRMVRTAILNAEKEKRRELIYPEMIDILISSVKQRKESIKAYENSGRTDLYEKEKLELDIILSYLPEQMSKEDIKKRVEEVIKQTNAFSMKDMGKVMKVLMAELKGRADGSLVNGIVREVLS